MSTSVWPLVHAERKALADDLANLTAEQWATPSLCSGWTVQDALAHQVATATLTPPTFLAALAASGFSFQKMTRKHIARYDEGGPAATLQRFTAAQSSTKAPPGPKDSWLGEAIVHGEDIRRPLGIKRDYPIASVLRVLDFYKGSNVLLGTKSRIDGLQLTATDADWSAGSGALLEGRAIDLLMAATGRKQALEELSGPGVDVLHER